jgi:processive 1,2-diacylglycerol beta-glucosyltransferase
MIHLEDKDTGAPIGTISEAQLQYLIDQLEEESREDQDYYINTTTLDLFEARGAEKALVGLLRSALEGRTEMEIRWSRR